MAEPYILVKLTEREKHLIEELRKLCFFIGDDLK